MDLHLSQSCWGGFGAECGLLLCREKCVNALTTLFVAFRSVVFLGYNCFSELFIDVLQRFLLFVLSPSSSHSSTADLEVAHLFPLLPT